MKQILLTTKLAVPLVSNKLVTRENLIQRLEAAGELNESVKLVLICAPAGFGKTTLLASWLSQSHQPAAWVSLDEKDNDPVQFWSYFLTAVEKLDGRLSTAVQTAQNLLHSVQSATGEVVLTLLLNALNSLPTNPGYKIILDDYHVITEPVIQQGLNFLIANLPPALQLVIASRVDPALPLSRLRARGQLLEIRAADLRFSLPEAELFLNSLMNLNLNAEQLNFLTNRTEGWITGLKLAALGARSHNDLEKFISEFAGTHRYIVDYLVEEILLAQPPELQNFLVQTSWLSRLNADLCASLTSQSVTETQAILQALEEANLFITPLDNNRRWYRYHQLFATVLQHRLNQQMARSEILALHLTACRWFIKNKLLPEAVEQALLGEDFEQAATLIEDSLSEIIQQNELATLAEWMKKLPPEVAEHHPRLRLTNLWQQLIGGKFEEGEKITSEIEKNLANYPANEQKIIEGQIATLRAVAYNEQTQFELAISQSQLALEKLPEDSLLTWRSVILLNLGWAYRYQNNVAAALKAYSEGVALCWRNQDYPLLLMLNTHLAGIDIERGKLQQAANTYRQLIALAESRGGVAFLACIWLAQILYERNELAEALPLLQKALKVSRLQNNLVAILGAASRLMELCLAQGQIEQAQEWLTFIEDSTQEVVEARLVAQHNTNVPKFGGAHFHEWSMAQQARFWLRTGNLNAAQIWAANYSDDFTKTILPALHLRENRPLTLVRVRLAERRPDRALALLERLRTRAQESEQNGYLIEILVLQALAFGQLADGQPKSLESLEQALKLAEPEKYRRVFLDEGQPLAKLLEQLSAQGKFQAYISELIQVVPATPVVETAPAINISVAIEKANAKLIEPLTGRELEVLQGLAEGWSNKELADRLVLAETTVKVHVRHIFEKLEVSTRTQAVAQARKLRLLD